MVPPIVSLIHSVRMSELRMYKWFGRYLLRVTCGVVVVLFSCVDRFSIQNGVRWMHPHTTATHTHHFWYCIWHPHNAYSPAHTPALTPHRFAVLYTTLNLTKSCLFA